MKKNPYRYFSFGLIKGKNLIKGGLKTCFALHTNDAVIGYRLISWSTRKKEDILSYLLVILSCSYFTFKKN